MVKLTILTTKKKYFSEMSIKYFIKNKIANIYILGGFSLLSDNGISAINSLD